MSTPRADAYPPAASQATVQQLLELDEAALALTGELDLPRLLQRIVDAARDLTGARYGALGILRPDGSLEYFLTSGLDPEQGARIGALPRGVGLLGVMSREARPVRVDRIADDPRRAGFPPTIP